MTTDLRDRFLTHVRGSELFPEPGLALLAVSGGPDSVALLDLFAGVAAELDIDLAIAHVEHGIAAESGAVAHQVADLARQYGLAYHETPLRLGPGASETRARRERYHALRAIQRETGARYLVTAHHADDQVETVLYRLLRGTAMAGLAGIPATGPNGLVRPLLAFTRSELGDWLEQRAAVSGKQLPVHHDPANVDERHDRSWVRHQLLRVLRERFGSAVDRHLLDIARHAARERAAWAALLRALPELEFGALAGAVEVAHSPLRQYDKVLCEALLRALAREVGCVLGPRRAAGLLAFVRTSSSGRTMQLGRGWEAELAFDKLRIVRTSMRRAGLDPVALQSHAGAAGRVDWGGWEISWREEPAGQAMRAAFSTWVTPGLSAVRAPARGDRLVPLGGMGHRKVRRLLMEAKIPVRERAAYPVLERNGHVLWLPGVCRSETAVPNPGELAVRIDARTSGHR